MSEEYFRFLERTRKQFQQVGQNLQKQKTLSDTFWKDLEDQLVAIGIGIVTSRWCIQNLQRRVNEEEIHSGSQVYRVLRQELLGVLGHSSLLRFSQQSPVTVMVLLGINGSGKTTSLAKLAYRLIHEGHTVLVAGADTFDSNGADLFKTWSQQVNIPVMHWNDRSDSDTVVYDALQSALDHGYDVVLVDTHDHLALKNIIHVVRKVFPDAPHELLFVIDATKDKIHCLLCVH